MNKGSFEIKENVPLAALTTMKLGGPARYFLECSTVDDLRAGLTFAQEKQLPTHVLTGGSNTVFSDRGFSGLVLYIALKGVAWQAEGEYNYVTAAAGENWDEFVQICITKNLAGLECLSGIPGSVGATPVQNVGAYGQDVSQTITEVEAFNRQTLTLEKFSNQACHFAYRTSRFKESDKDKYIVTSVTFKLNINGSPTLKYPELIELLSKARPLNDLSPGQEQLQAVRQATLTLRRKKSMVIDDQDPNTRSCGSFFINALITPQHFTTLQKNWAQQMDSPIPHFPTGDKIKIPSAWLVEHAGFPKGYRKNGVGISTKHNLALINVNGTTEALLDLASQIQQAVKQRFEIDLIIEPIVVEDPN